MPPSRMPHSRSLSQVALRSFGKYYSIKQTCALVAALRCEQGSTLAARPRVSPEDLLRLLADHDRWEGRGQKRGVCVCVCGGGREGRKKYIF